MGCNIHVYLEKRHKAGAWFMVDSFSCHTPYTREQDKHNWSMPTCRDRNYERFARLAGVRGDGPEPRGLPDDISDSVMFLVGEIGEDGHSHSWLPLVDAIKIFSETENWFTWEKEDCFARKYPEYHFFNVDCENGFENYRIVFWFDN